ncbi:unnamed protein product, partial [Cylicostephanus goldi]
QSSESFAHATDRIVISFVSLTSFYWNVSRFLTGELEDESEEEEEGERDPNIIREDKKKKKQELHFAQVDDLKNKWKTGDVETAEQKEAKEKKELEILKVIL